MACSWTAEAIKTCVLTFKRGRTSSLLASSRTPWAVPTTTAGACWIADDADAEAYGCTGIEGKAVKATVSATCTGPPRPMVLTVLLRRSRRRRVWRIFAT